MRVEIRSKAITVTNLSRHVAASTVDIAIEAVIVAGSIVLSTGQQINKQ